MTKKILLNKKPSYLARRLQPAARGSRSSSTIQQVTPSLGISREGFVNRGAKLFNMLSGILKPETSVEKFKKMAKKWTKENIPLMP